MTAASPPPPPRRRRPSRFRKAALQLLLTLLALAGAEVLLRGLGWRSEPRAFDFQAMADDLVTEHEARYRAHPERFYELAPDYVFAPGHLGRYAVGRWNYRGPPAEPRPPGALRVLVLGDSCVYGAALDPADTIPQKLARGLAERGLGPADVQVLNLGVPGYSTVQVDLLLKEALAGMDPDAVVLYTASWNDQVPALGRNDLELLEAVRHPPLLDRLRRGSALVSAVFGLFAPSEVDPALKQAALDGWSRDDPPDGYRVPRPALEATLRGMVGRCREAGVDLVMVGPVHPVHTEQQYPRAREDADTVVRVARALGVPLVDGRAVLEAAPGPFERYFADYVHPSPEGAARLARGVAETLMPLLAARRLVRPAAPDAGSPRVLAVEPERGITFGDATLTVTVAGLRAGDGLPSVCVGGAPLLHLRADGPELTGELGANAAGDHDVVLRSRRGVAVAPGAYHLDEPSLAVEPGDQTTLVFRSRPGDRCRVLAATERLAVPVWSHRGPGWLPQGSLVELPVTLEAGADGAARVPFPSALPGGPLFLQAVVLPAGDPERMRNASRWSPVCTLPAGG